MDYNEQPIDQGGISFWKAVTIALWLFLAQVLVLVPFMIYEHFKGGGFSADDLSSTNIGLTILIYFPLAVLLVLRKNKLPQTAWSFRQPFLLPFIAAFIFTFSVSFLLGDLLTYLPGYEGMQDNYGRLFGEIKPIYLLLGGVFIGPVCEEIIFRGVILEQLIKRYEPWKAIVFSAIIFGVVHGVAIQVVYAFVLGLAIGWIYFRTRSLWLCIIIHVVNNAVAFWGGSDSSESLQEVLGGDLQYYASLAGALLIAGASAWAFTRSTPKPKASEAEELA